MPVLVSGIGMINGLGTNTETIWQNLLQLKSALIPTTNGVIAPIHLPTARDQYRVEQLLQIAVMEAVSSAKLTLPLPDCAVVIGSSRGYQREWELLFQQQISLESYPYLLSANLSRCVCQWLGSKNYAETISIACASGNWAIAIGYELIRSQQAELVLVGAVDTAITPLTIAGFRQLGVFAKEGVYPFSKERQGLGLGEGAGVLILESLEHFHQRNGRTCYGQILGASMSNDACHITASDPQLQAVKWAIAQCLAIAKLSYMDIQYISAHGTATVKNDQIEAAIIEQLFPHQPLVSSNKGAIGHCLGASGIMGGIFCLLAMRDQILPPCTGVNSPAFPLNLVREPIAYPLTLALNFSFGFGGQNTIVAIGHKQLQ
ncbi:MAG: beta-ketoacyl synthase N-terminal-like domain-containing protein [Pseudanabaenaceae cyanobacterium]